MSDMATLVINPRQALLALEKSGMPTEQANEIVKIFEDIEIGHLATKSDVEMITSKLKAELIQFMFLQTFVITGLTVTLIKFL